MKKMAFISTIATLCIAATLFYMDTPQSKDSSKTDNTSQTQEKDLLEKLLPTERNNIKVFKESAPQVVFVHNLRYQRNYYSFTEVQQGAGSGFIWDDQGHIVTNFHVINGSDNVAITLQDGKNLKAKIVGYEPRKDIAVLKVDLKGLNGFKRNIADSHKLLVGQKAVAIGNPFGLDHSLSVGIISALGRSFPSPSGVTIRDMIQTDAAINPGNSGGPLLNSSGQLIGMNTAIYSKSGSSAGIGFAVPSNTIKRIVSQIIQHGKVIQVGIGIIPYPDHIAKNIGISGVIIHQVPSDSSAEKVGLRGVYRDKQGRTRLGDIIIGIDSTKITNYDDIYNALEKRNVGEKVKITYLRNNKKRSLKLKLIKLN